MQFDYSSQKMEELQNLLIEMQLQLVQVPDASFVHEDMIENQEFDVQNVARLCATYTEGK